MEEERKKIGKVEPWKLELIDLRYHHLLKLFGGIMFTTLLKGA